VPIRKSTTIAAAIVLAAQSSAALDVPPDLDAAAMAKWNAMKAAGYVSSRTCGMQPFGSCMTEILLMQNGELVLLREMSAPGGGMTYREICVGLVLSHPQLLCEKYGPTPQS
jgi:hypothetical protein